MSNLWWPQKNLYAGRRTFLKTTGAAATVVAVGTTSAARAAEQRKVVLGIIGPGGMGIHHVRNLCMRKDVEIAYVCDVDQKRLAAAAKHVETETKQAPKTVKDMREIFDDQKVEAVFIATPEICKPWYSPCLAVDSADKDASQVIQPRHEEAVDGADPIDDGDLPALAGAVTGDDLVIAVAVNIPTSNPDATNDAGRIRQEAHQQLAGGREHLHMRQRPRVGPDDDLVASVPVHICGPDEDAAHEALEGEEGAHQHPGYAVERLDVTARCLGPGSDDDFGLAVAVEVAARDMDAAGEALEGEEGSHQRSGSTGEDLDVTTRCPGPGSDDDFGLAVAVEVAAADEGAAGEALDGDEGE